MTPASPTWGDVEAFLAADGWRRVGDVFYEKVLDDGRVLQAQASQAPWFGAILRNQLEVSRDEFWECIRTGKPVARPVPLEAAPVEHDAWVVAVLVGELHMTAEQLEALSPDEARRLVCERWSKPEG